MSTIQTDFIPDTDLYVSAKEVVDFLGINITPSDSTDPTKTVLESFIKMAMAELERRTNKAWRIKAYKQLVKDVPRSWSSNRGIPIYLAHTDVMELDVDEGDSLEVWDGDEYRDVTNEVDLYQIPRLGKIFVKGYVWSWLRDDRIRVTYRYRSDLTEDVKEATLKLTSIKLIDRNFTIKSMAFGGNLNPQEAADKWRTDIDDFVSQVQEFTLVEH